MTKTMKIQGMMCQHCVAHVKKALEALPGVSADVRLEEGKAVVTLSQPTEDGALIAAVTGAGYQAEVE